MMSAGVSIKPHTGTENRPLLPPEKVIIVGSSNQDLTSYSNVIPKLGQTVLGSSIDHLQASISWITSDLVKWLILTSVILSLLCFR